VKNRRIENPFVTTTNLRIRQYTEELTKKSGSYQTRSEEILDPQGARRYTAVAITSRDHVMHEKK
jgi:hypothetical protein